MLYRRLEWGNKSVSFSDFAITCITLTYRVIIALCTVLCLSAEFCCLNCHNSFLSYGSFNKCSMTGILQRHGK